MHVDLVSPAYLRRRGGHRAARLRHVRQAEEHAAKLKAKQEADMAAMAVAEPPKRKRGRPRKVKVDG